MYPYAGTSSTGGSNPTTIVLLGLLVAGTLFIGYVMGKLGGKPKLYLTMRKAVEESTQDPQKWYEFCEDNRTDSGLMDMVKNYKAYADETIGGMVTKVQGKIKTEADLYEICGFNENADTEQED